jgi:hypothetical protein
MKRNLLDITQKISRKFNRAILKPYNLNDSNYFIFEANGYRLTTILREIEYRKNQDRLNIRINTQNISPRDYEIEEGGTGLLIKFKKSNFSYSLDKNDVITIIGDIEKYA